MRHTVAVFFLLAAATLHAEDAAAPAITWNGFVSASYTLDAERPDSGSPALRVFDFDDRTFRVDVVELVAQRAAAKPGDVGFRADLVAGQAIPRVSAASGLFRDSQTGHAEDVDLQQAFVTWIAPAGRGLRFDAGKFVTHAGLELIEGYDGWNDNYSRSILFGYAIPFTHTGLKVSYPISSKVSLMGMLANGWDNAKDNNSQKSVGAQLALTPSPKLSAYVNYCGGAERSGSSDWRNLLDVVVIVKPTPRLSLGANLDLAREKGAAAPGDATWRGIAGYARLGLGERVAVALRAERFEDEDGVRTGTAQDLTEFTGTLEWRTGPVAVRGEIRRDSSNHDVFPHRERLQDSQVTLAANVLYAF